MKIKFYLLSVLLFSFCNEPKSLKTSNSLELYDLTLGKNIFYGVAKHINNTKEQIIISVDLVNYYTGKDAINQIKKEKTNDYDVNENGDTIYFLPNNYYISYQNSTIKHLLLSKDVHIKLYLLNEIKYEIEFSDNATINVLTKHLKNKPLLQFSISSNQVILIEEIFLP